MSDPFLPPDSDPHPMQPLSSSRRGSSRRRSSPSREPIQAFLEATSPPDEEELEEIFGTPEESLPRARHRQADPLVAYLLILSLGIGISPFEALIRYTILWTLMAMLGSVAYLLGGMDSLRETRIDDLVWGITFGFFASFPFLVVFGSALTTVSARMFDVSDVPSTVMNTWVFLAIAFVQPLSETLFFRGGMQSVRSVFLTAALATLWSAMLYFPHMELRGQTAIGMILLVVFTLLNFLYSYVRFRNGLAGAWLCQVVSYTLLWFIPRLIYP